MNQNPERGVGRLSAFALAIGMMSATSAVMAQQPAPAAAPSDPTTTAEPSASTETTPAAPSGTAAPKATTLGVVKVTGSRIKSKTLTASSPVIEIGGEEFERTGATLVEELVNQFPQLAPTFDNAQNNPSLGYATVDLRGLGPERTLTLVNGRRLPKGFGEFADISIIPASLVKRVDVLTGGASAVYGSDAVAGVVNFILDDKFTGVSLTGGWSAYNHNNNNKSIGGKLDERGFARPKGDSGFDGIARNLDLAIGGRFGESGHATAWATYRENDPIFQGERDYSSCALSATGVTRPGFNGGNPTFACGGSATADPANFYVVDVGAGFYSYAQGSTSSMWSVPDGPNLYNFAPINYFQRPDTRFTGGASVSYEISEFAKPYLETMFVNRKSTVQIAPSGAFFTPLANLACDTPEIGTLCADLGLGDDGIIDTLYVAKRNVEGGPRINSSESNNFSITPGIGGKLIGNWDYDASLTYSRASTVIVGTNDFLTSRIQDALLGCQDGSFDGCVPYEVFAGTVTPAQAQTLQGISQQQIITSTQGFNAFVTGDLGVGLPTAAGKPVGLVLGVETRRETYSYSADQNLADGNFAGSGSQSPALSESTAVKEFYLESGVPILANFGVLNALDLELGYRASDYESFGYNATYKIGFGANFLDDKYRVRGGFNRAVRAPTLNDLFLPQQIGLWVGADPCAGAAPEYTAEQCANTGVTAAQYGSVASNPAGQYNQIAGGNTTLQPEKADTFTIGFAATPIKALAVSLDYFNIDIKDALGGVGARNLLDICALTGDATSCALINRSAQGDLFRGSDPATSGSVTNVTQNLGGEKLSGLDLTVAYSFRVGPGKLSANIFSTYLLDATTSPLQSDSTVAADCVGNISPQCQLSKYRHIAGIRYDVDRYSAGLRWRYASELDYVDPRQFREGRALNADRLTCAPANTPVTAPGARPAAACVGGQGIEAYNWFDLTGSVTFGPALLTLGVNNIFDKEPPITGSTLALNANSPGGYDQLGRYIFSSLKLDF
ncbi:MAG: TonB-dependent receptor [Pseudomonadota bacterium]